MTENLKKFSWLKKLFASTFVLLMLLSVLTVPASASSTSYGPYDSAIGYIVKITSTERFFKIWNSNTYENVPTITGLQYPLLTPKETLMSGEARLIYRYSPYVIQNCTISFPRGGVTYAVRRASTLAECGEWG